MSAISDSPSSAVTTLLQNAATAATTSTSTASSTIVTNTSEVNQSAQKSITVDESIFKKSNKTETGIENNSLTVFISLLSGASAGALAKTTIAPLDRAKINFQINKEIAYSFRAASLFLTRTFEKEGFLALWRGNSATMARIIPYAAIQFTAHEQWKKVLSVDKNESTNVKRFMAGSLAGITSQSLTYPLDLARARMAVTDKYTGYRSLRHVFVRIWVDEGPAVLFKGYWATILGVIPYAGTSFFTYETLKNKYYDITGEKKPTPIYTLGFGAIAGVIGQTSSYPLDIVRRRMQTVGVKKDTASTQYRSILSTLRSIYRDEGIKGGFFKGLSMNWIKGPIAVGISFSTYDFIKEFLRQHLS